MIENHNLMLSEMFAQLRERNGKDFDDLYKILCLYENFREALSLLSSELYGESAVATGKAISNICFDLMRHPSAVILSNAGADIIKNGHVFFLAHRGGLCNRLRAIAALDAAAELIGFQFSFAWAETDMCRGGPLPWRNFANRASPVMHKISRNQTKIVLEDNPISAWQFFDRFRKIGLLGSWHDFNDTYIKKSGQILDRLIHALSASSVIENFFVKNELESYTAVHIRRTDFVPYFAEKYPDERLPEVSEYIDYIRASCGGEKVFLSTDDVDVRKDFVSSLGDQVCFFDNFDFDKNKIRQTSFLHSVLDVAVLSRSSELLITPRSSFSDYAASISGAKLVKL